MGRKRGEALYVINYHKSEPYVASNVDEDDESKSFAVLVEHARLGLLSRCRRHWYKIFGLRGESKFNIMYLLKIMPVSNFMIDLFFDGSTMRPGSVSTLLDAFGLINGLLLAVALDFCVNVEIDEMLEVDERFWHQEGTGYYDWWHTWFKIEPSQYYYQLVVSSLIILFTNICLVIYVYADMTAKIPEPEFNTHEYGKYIFCQKDQNGKLLQVNTFSSTHKNHRHGIITSGYSKQEVIDSSSSLIKLKREKILSQKKVQYIGMMKWWGWSKYAIVILFLSSFVGVTYIAFAGMQLFICKYPDYFMLQFGRIQWGYQDSMRGYMLATFTATFIGVMVAAIVIAGFGTTSKYLREDDYDELEWFNQELARVGLSRVMTLRQRIKTINSLEEGSKKCVAIRTLLEYYLRFLVDAHLELPSCREYLAIFRSSELRSFQLSPVLTKSRLDYVVFNMIGKEGLAPMKDEDWSEAVTESEKEGARRLTFLS